jgi:hypothetical protein
VPTLATRMPRWSVDVEEPELPFPPHEGVAAPTCHWERSPFSTFDCCPMCGGDMTPEHAHFRCGSCGWRDSCCD